MPNSFIDFVVAQGVPIETVTLILMLPIVVTLIAFFRQVLGIKAFGIYTPALVIFAFLAIGIESNSFWNGVKYGSAIFAVVITVGTISRFLLNRIRLLYLPRVAIMITIVSFSVLLMLIVGGYFRRTGLAGVSIFPILIMVTLVEKFIATQIEKGARTAIILAIETLLISIVGYFIASWGTLIAFLQTYPWAVLFTFVINIYLGKWTGLRLFEYYRFKDVIKNVEITPKK